MVPPMSQPARIVLAVSLSLALLQLGACRKAASAKQESKEFVVAPGKFAEVNVRMVAKAKVTATFKADAKVQWDTHSHPLGKTVYHSKGEDASGKLAITADKQATYSFLWKNDSAKPIKLRVTLNLPRGTEVDSWVGHK